jgi:hypothetical protein
MFTFTIHQVSFSSRTESWGEYLDPEQGKQQEYGEKSYHNLILRDKLLEWSNKRGLENRNMRDEKYLQNVKKWREEAIWEAKK